MITALIKGAEAQGAKVAIAGPLYADALGPAGTYEGTYIGMMDHNLNYYCPSTRRGCARGWISRLGCHSTIPFKMKSGNMTTDPNVAASLPLSIRDMTVAYQRKPVLWEVNLDIPQGALVGLVGTKRSWKEYAPKGSNGDGSNSLRSGFHFRAILSSAKKPGRLRPATHSVDWDFPATVGDVVMMGTYGDTGWFLPLRDRHRARARAAMNQVGIADLESRQISQLSGGQQQRAFLARALAQQADLYLMDEPFAAVDAATERAIVDVLRALQQEGKTNDCCSPRLALRSQITLIILFY